MKYNTAMKYNGWIQTIRDLKNEKFELIDSENNTDLVETVKNTISIIKTNNELLDKCVYAGLNLNNITIVEVEINKLFIHLFGESETAKLYNVNSLDDLFNSMFALMEVLRVLEELINIRLRSEGIETDKTAIRNVSDSEKLENIQYDINWNIADNKLHTDFKIIPNLIEVQLQHVKNLDKYVKKKPETDFDCSDTTNPLVFDLKLIYDLHRDFTNYLWNVTYIERFKNCFRETPEKLQFHENITWPEVCYFFSKIEPLQTVVSPFKKWIKFHIGNINYGKNKAEFDRIITEVKELKRNGFSLTVPQQKALANKEKIDNLFKRMQID